MKIQTRNDGLNQSERLERINEIAVSQIKILSESNIKYLKNTREKIEAK